LDRGWVERVLYFSLINSHLSIVDWYPVLCVCYQIYQNIWGRGSYLRCVFPYYHSVVVVSISYIYSYYPVSFWQFRWKIIFEGYHGYLTSDSPLISQFHPNLCFLFSFLVLIFISLSNKCLIRFSHYIFVSFCKYKKKKRFFHEGFLSIAKDSIRLGAKLKQNKKLTAVWRPPRIFKGLAAV
jgi:hypothetical protein